GGARNGRGARQGSFLQGGQRDLRSLHGVPQPLRDWKRLTRHHSQGSGLAGKLIGMPPGGRGRTIDKAGAHQPTDGETEALFHDFVEWLQYELGKSGPDGLSWSNQLWESLNIWNVVEGTHVLTLMFFAGTIWIVDLRMMGLAFRNMPFSKLNDRVLPITMVSFGVMVLTGVLSFFGRDPLLYYHDIWFRLKMTFLVIAAINIFWFHYRVQKSQAEWDALPSPPVKVKL